MSEEVEEGPPPEPTEEHVPGQSQPLESPPLLEPPPPLEEEVVESPKKPPKKPAKPKEQCPKCLRWYAPAVLKYRSHKCVPPVRDGENLAEQKPPSEDAPKEVPEVPKEEVWSLPMSVAHRAYVVALPMTNFTMCTPTLFEVVLDSSEMDSPRDTLIEGKRTIAARQAFVVETQSWRLASH